MPPRDEQDWQTRRDQIMDGALQVFAHKGFEQATNKDIAEAAKIGSPGLIYHYFKDKADLFKQMIERHAPVLQLLDHSADIDVLPPREALTLFGTAIIKTLDNVATLALFRVILGESIRRPAVAEMMNRLGPGRGFPFLMQYMQRQMDQGVFKPMDPGAAARCFVGPLVGFVLTREVFPQTDSQTLTSEVMVATTINIFLGGIQIVNDSP